MPEKTVAAVNDASRRLNLLVGVLSSTNRGAPIRWWSYVTSSSGGGIGYTLGANDPSATLALIQLLAPEPQASVSAALYWIREPRGMLLEHHGAMSSQYTRATGTSTIEGQYLTLNVGLSSGLVFLRS